MAPIYDTRDSEPSSDDDDSYEKLDVLGDMFNENQAQQDGIDANGSSDHAVVVKDEVNDDSTEAVDAPIDQELPVGPVEKLDSRSPKMDHDYGHSSHSVERKASIDSHKGDGDKLKRLDALIESGVHPDLLHKLIEEVIAFSATTVNPERAPIVVDNPAGQERTPEFPQSDGKKSKPLKDPSQSNSTVKEAKTTPTTHKTLKPKGRWSSQNGEEYIESHVDRKTKIPQLGLSARLMYGNMELVIYSQGCLMITDENFVAKVSLDRPQLLKGARNFQHAADEILNQLRIDQVFVDEATANQDKHRKLFLSRLEQLIV